MIKDCPDCNGTGVISDPGVWEKLGKDYYQRIYENIECDTCGGSGEVDDD